jgi:hypothetical protein
LRNRLKDTSITAAVLLPSVTGTNYVNRADMLDAKSGASGSKDDPNDRRHRGVSEPGSAG